jgi:hypothetical protein
MMHDTKFADRLTEMYNEAIKADEELQQRIHDAYVKGLEHDEEVEQAIEFQIEAEERRQYQQELDSQDPTRFFKTEDGEARLVEVNAGTRRKQEQDYE